ncbi:MAG: elongation factor G [Planctomycetes bacterium]|nr:elongation factor G [Planctomycetota bacterium]
MDSAYTTDQIRNIALVGACAGKTTLADLLLFKAGGVTRRGSPADGTSALDWQFEEREARHTHSAKLVHFKWRGWHVNLLDTPGYPDFVGEAISALCAVDAVIVVADANGSLPFNTRRLFQAARDHQLATFLVFNRMDGDQASFDKAYEHARELLGHDLHAAVRPDEDGAEFKAVRSVLVPGSDAAARADLVESAVETDDQAMEPYLERNTIDDAEFDRVYDAAVRRGQIVPVLCCSAEKDIGVEELVDHVVKHAPSPATAAGRRLRGKEGEAVARTRSGEPTCAQVWKTVADPHVGKQSWRRVWSGTVRHDTPLVLERLGKPERLANLVKPQGKTVEPITIGIAGDIVAIAKVEHLATGDTLCDAARVRALAPIDAPKGMVSLAVDPKNRNDEQKMAEGLRKLAAEDLTFEKHRDPATHEQVITGISNLHLETLMKRLKERYHVEVTTRPPRIALKETVIGRAEGHYRHQKQTGGSGQFAEVFLKIEPEERGAGFEFSDEVTQGKIPRQYIPAVEKGIVAGLPGGSFAGYPIVDVCVRLYDGKDHDVDSNDTSFRFAGWRAFKDAFAKAKPVLLEPIVDLVVEVPAAAMGDVTGDLNSRHGRISGMDSLGNLQVVKAKIPLREILDYSTKLRSMTAGEGSYHYPISHYDVVPARIAADLATVYKPKEDE